MLKPFLPVVLGSAAVLMVAAAVPVAAQDAEPFSKQTNYMSARGRDRYLHFRKTGAWLPFCEAGGIGDAGIEFGIGELMSHEWVCSRLKRNPFAQVVIAVWSNSNYMEGESSLTSRVVFDRRTSTRLVQY